MIQSKFLSLRPLGWKRICKNTQRFGWELTDAKEHVTTETKTTYKETHYYDRVEVTPETKTTTTRRIHLSFIRDTERFEGLASVRALETLYGIVYLFRSIANFATKVLWVVALIIAFMGEIGSEFGAPIGEYAFIVLFVWLGLRLVENIIASIAYKRLQPRY
jgi:hypothetical protein